MGTGDGSYVINQARQNPETFFIGIDTNVSNLEHSSRKTFIFSEKKGLKNALFVQAGVEALPPELYGLAHQITVILPWGTLLKAVAKPDIDLLNEIKKLCRENASFRVVYGYDHATEQKQVQELGLAPLTPDNMDKVINTYASVGFKAKWRYLSQEELKLIPSTWAKKLAYGKKRQFLEILGEKID